MAIAMLILPLMDAFAKLLSTTYGVNAGQTTFGRFMVQATLLCLVILVLRGPKALKLKRPGINLLRGAIMGIAVSLFFTTLRYMPIADAIAVFFIEPFVLTALSVIFLGEKVGWRRLGAVIVGFIGALFIIQPSYEGFGPVSLLPMGTAVLFAIYLLITRKFAEGDDPLAMQFMSGIGGAATLLVAMVVGTLLNVDNYELGLPDTGVAWTLIFAIGVLATIGHLMVVIAFKWANASILAPFQYLEIVGATAFGYYFFGDFPDALKWLGIAIIIGSGLYLFVRERAASEEN